MPESSPAAALAAIAHRIERARDASARVAPVRLLAVGKTQAADALAAVAGAGQRAFGENYVQEAAGKIEALDALGLEWHLIGHLQSNKAKQAAALFDWVQTVDRRKLVDVLDAHRPDARGPLNVLVQVNIDDETSKHGCAPSEVAGLVEAIRAAPRLRLRGLMAIPAPHAEPARRRDAFARMRRLFDTVAGVDPGIDTLSMGMSDDLELAIAEGATMVRVGSALFGARARR
ncbi:YggS family pyridoxal phosphate-dependent enzyme [Luteimonas sp BLCC-B24]|uniref:YggS family pyridoxal phosphate-dependent enzyme n=1 Tax=Luteimonas sp. BLCC-B24 TaxID=3025317 RepID=UPI00234D21C8|nr:YggS family pyridoxal phosphate-dependent enzyme [Luteimonas sp. BLCC-B24]MDC7806000.1 YggS family pyridoxal phosphate-dependent enzyme [Luteimonas sp. BLCC-B24]